MVACCRAARVMPMRADYMCPWWCAFQRIFLIWSITNAAVALTALSVSSISGPRCCIWPDSNPTRLLMAKPFWVKGSGRQIWRRAMRCFVMPTALMRNTTWCGSCAKANTPTSETCRVFIQTPCRTTTVTRCSPTPSGVNYLRPANSMPSKASSISAAPLNSSLMWRPILMR